MPEAVDLSVCVTCQHGDARPGMQLHHVLKNMLNDHENVRLHAVECMSVCKRPCTIAVSSPGKWSYIIGDIDAAIDAPAVLEYVATYASSENGTPPLKQRPAAIRRGTIARLPPLIHKELYANS